MWFPRGRWEPGSRRPGGDIGGQGIQLRVGGKHLTEPLVKLFLGQPSLHERGLERVKYLLTVGLRCDKAAAATLACCYLVSRLDHRGASYEDD
jgi:hypothetical protein